MKGCERIINGHELIVMVVLVLTLGSIGGSRSSAIIISKYPSPFRHQMDEYRIPYRGACVQVHVYLTLPGSKTLGL